MSSENAPYNANTERRALTHTIRVKELRGLRKWKAKNKVFLLADRSIECMFATIRVPEEVEQKPKQNSGNLETIANKTKTRGECCKSVSLVWVFKGDTNAGL